MLHFAALYVTNNNSNKTASDLCGP